MSVNVMCKGAGKAENIQANSTALPSLFGFWNKNTADSI